MRAQFTLTLALTIAAIFASPALAQNATPERKIEVKPVFATPGEARAGSLLLKSNDQERNADAGRFVEAPRLGTDIDLVVSGPTIRARVTQMFHNPTDGWVEAIYVYPLPDASAVDTMKMVIGERIVVGEIKERAQARVIYEQAKASGRKARLHRTGAAQHLHQLGRQYRTGRERAGADRIPGAGAPVGRPVLAARAAGRGAAL